ncbi:MAG: hypothetical protein PVI78_07800 [Anaerolineales bacterium]
MALLDRKAMKLATQEGGEIGPLQRQASAGGRVAQYVGDELPSRKSGQAVVLIGEFKRHIGLLVQQGIVRHDWLLIPKDSVLHWGAMKRRDIVAQPDVDLTAKTVMGFLYGPIGALVSEKMDEAVAQKEGSKPVIGITYDRQGVENSIFLDFPLSRWYYSLSGFLMHALPGKLRE